MIDAIVSCPSCSKTFVSLGCTYDFAPNYTINCPFCIVSIKRAQITNLEKIIIPSDQYLTLLDIIANAKRYLSELVDKKDMHSAYTLYEKIEEKMKEIEIK